jgi:hypothetical protein
MSRSNWNKAEGGFALHGHRLSREEIKAINARLDGQEVAPKRRIHVPQSLIPKGWIPHSSQESLSSQVRDERLDLLHSLGQQMLEAAQEA